MDETVDSVVPSPERPAAASEIEVTEDEVIAFSEALELRRVLNIIKAVAKLFPADDMPTPFQSAWAECCEEIFYRATEEQWHMDQDSSRFAKSRELARMVASGSQESGSTE